MMHKRRLIVVLIILGSVLVALAYNHFFVSAQEDVRIQYGETKNSSIVERESQEKWPFEGKSGDVIAVHVSRTSGNLIPAVSLSDPKNTMIVGLDWPADGPALSQFTVTLRSTGIHTLTIGGSARTTGDYTLNLELLTAGIAETIDNTIAYGQIETGKISDEVFRQYWSFHGNQDDIVDIAMTARSGNLDSFLSLIAPDGNVTATTSTGGSGLDAALYSVKLPFSGTYTIVTRRAGNDFGETASTEGTYDLSLALRVPGRTENRPVPTSLILGTTVLGQITADAPSSLYSVETSGVLSLSLETTDIFRIGTVSVMTPDHALLGVFSGPSPLRGSLVLPGQGTVLVEVTARNIRGNAPLDFALNVDQLKTSGSVSRPLQYNHLQHVPASDTSSVDAWHFGAEAGDLITLSLKPNSLVVDGRLEIRAPDGTSLFSQPIRNGIEQSLALNTTGIYELFVDPGAVNVGYQVAVELDGIKGVTFAQRVLSEDIGRLVPGVKDLVQGDLTATRSDAWVFEVTEAQLWNFYLSTPDDGRVALAIEKPDGSLLDVGVTSDFSNQLLLAVALPDEGRYRAVVFDPMGVSSQSYQLSAEVSAGGPLPTRVQRKGVLAGEISANRWLIDVPSRSLLSIDIDSVNTSIVPEISVIGPDGRLISVVSDDENNLVGIPFLTGGVVEIIVSQQSNNSYLAYNIRADYDQPFTSETVWNTQEIPNSEVFATDVPVVSTQRVLLPQVIMPSVGIETTTLSSAPFLERDTLVRGQMQQDQLFGVWTFQAQADRVLALTVTSIDETVEPIVQILDQSGIVLAQNQTSGTTSSYLIHRFSAGGAYYALVQLPSGSRYTLWLESISDIDETLPAVASAHSIHYGDTVFGELTHSDETLLYTFYGHNDDVIYIRLNRIGGYSSAHIALQDINGQTLAETDLATDVWSINLSNIELPENQAYQIVVTPASDKETNSVQLSLHLNLQSSSPYSDHDGKIIGEQVISSLSGENENQYWLFNAQAEEQITVILEPLTAGAPTPLRLALADTGGHIFLAKEANLGHGTLRFSNILLPRTGVYQVIVSGGQRIPGLYRLRVERSEKRMGKDAGALRYGETVGEVLTTENYLDVWTLAGSKGDVVNISARAVRGDLIPISFQIRTSDGQVLATVIDDGKGAGAHVENLVLPANGHYSIAVGNVDSSFQGQTAYEITAYLMDTSARSMGTLIEYGQEAEGTFYADDSADIWLFEGQQGDIVTISAVGENPLLRPTLTLVSTDWHAASSTQQVGVLTSVQAVENDPAIIDRFVLPSSGTYAIDIQDSLYVGGTYRIRLMGVAALSPTVETLSSGRSEISQISPVDSLDVWTFVGVKDSLVNITIAPDSRSELAPAFSVIAPNGITIATSKAKPREIVTIQDLLLSFSGVYTVRVTRVLESAGQTNGWYSIELQETTVDSNAKPTVYDRLERSVLDETIPIEYWAFAGQAGDVVQIRVEGTSGDLDPVVHIFSPEGVLFAEADDVEGLNAEVTSELFADGTYIVEVMRYGGSAGKTSGNYSLIATRVYRDAAVNATPAIAYGERVTGVVDLTTPDNKWGFSGEAGDVISAKIQFPLDDAPLVLTLQDPMGNTLMTGIRDRGDVILEGFVLPVSGIYNLNVHRPADARAQDYSPYALDLQLLDFTLDGESSQGGELSLSQAVVGLFTEAPASHSWIFAGNNGQSVDILLTSLDETLDCSLVAPDGAILLQTTSFDGHLSTGAIQLPLTGTYSLHINGNNQSLGSMYRLRIQEIDVAAQQEEVLTIPGDVSGAISDLHPVQTWEFEGLEGDTISLRLNRISGDFLPKLMLWGPDGQPLTEGVIEHTSDSTQVSVSSFMLPQDGYYQVSIAKSDEFHGAGEYRLLLRENNITAQAVSATDVAFDSPVFALSYGSAPTYYAFHGTMGDVIAISVATQVGTLGMQLETETGVPVNIPVSTSGEEISMPFFLVPENNRYILTLIGKETTAYTLIVTRREAEIPPDSRIRNLGMNQPFLDSIDNPASPTYWLFSGTVGEVLSFTVDTSASGLRADVALFGPNGYIVGATEPLSEHSNLSFGPIRLNQTGDYFVSAQSWLGPNGGTTGRYSIRADQAQPGVSGSTGGYIPIIGATVTGGIIPEDQEDIWTFDGEAGEVISINVQHDNPLSIYLRSPNEVELTQAALAGEITSIEHFTLPETGRYNIVVQGQASTEYRLRITENRSALMASLDDAQKIIYGETVSVSASPNIYKSWSFFGKAGERIEAVLQTETGFSEFFLINPRGLVLFATHSETANSTLIPPIGLVETGFYSLVARVQNEEQVPLTLTLSQINNGTALQGILTETASGELSFSLPVHEWTISPVFSGHYLISLNSLTVREVPDLFIKQEDGSFIANGVKDSSGQNEAVVFLEAGYTYMAVISNGPDMTRQDYEVSISPASIITGGGVLTVDNPDIGHISDSHFTDEWVLEIQVVGAKNIEIVQISGNLVPVVSVYDLNGVLIKEGQAGQDGVLTLPIELLETGRYTMLVSRVGLAAGLSEGNYTIRVNNAS